MSSVTAQVLFQFRVQILPSTVKMNESVSGLPVLLLMPESGSRRRFVAKSHFLFVNAPLRKHPSGINEDQKKKPLPDTKKGFCYI